MPIDAKILIIGLVSYYALVWLGLYCYDHRESISAWIRRMVSQMVSWIMPKLRNVVQWHILAYGEVKRFLHAIWKKYGTGTNFRKALTFACYVGILCWLLWSFENNWWTWYVAHIRSYVDIPTALANILLCVYVLGLVLSLVLHKYYKRSFLWKEHFYPVMTIGVLYVWFRLFSSVFNFTPLSFIDTSIGYVDVIVVCYILCLVIRLVQERSRKKYIEDTFKEKEGYYLYDAPVEDHVGDTLKYRELATAIEQKIETLTRKHSWAIGIVGPWGSGKTSYMNLIREDIPEDKYLVVSFNPRFASKSAKIQEMALNTLADAIKPYNTGIRHLMRQYVSALQLDGANGWLQAALSLVKHTYSLTDIKEELEKVLVNLPKQVIYIFDDFDRLTRGELIEVLKLIDGNAKFKNIIYIAAYDREHVGKLLNNHNYIEKYFSIEIHVPWATPEDAINYVNSELNLLIPQANKQDKLAMSISEVIGFHRKLFKRVVKTIRDAKRYINTIKTDVLTIYTPDLDMEDFLLIELLKYYNTSLYEKLFIAPERYCLTSAYYTINKSAPDYPTLSEVELDLLDAMFPKESTRRDRPNRIRKQGMFWKYFIRPEKKNDRVLLSDLFSSKIDEAQVHNLLEEANSRADDAKVLIGDIDQYGRKCIDNIDSFKRYVQIILHANSIMGDRYVIPDTWDIFRVMFCSSVNVQTKIRATQDLLAMQIMQYYLNNRWTQGDVSVLSGVIPDLYYVSKVSEYVIKKERMAPIIRAKFDQMSDEYVANPEGNDFDLLIRVFYLCIDHIDPDTYKIYLDADCCKKMKDVIEQAPAEYVERFVRLGGQSTAADMNYIACEPFWKQIFGSAREIERFMGKLDPILYPRLARMRNFWRIYRANYCEMVEFRHQGDVQEIINADLTEQVKQLEVLKKMDTRLYRAIKMENRVEQKKEVTEIMNRVNQIPLDVKYKYRIYNGAKKIVYELSVGVK